MKRKAKIKATLREIAQHNLNGGLEEPIGQSKWGSGPGREQGLGGGRKNV